MEAIFNDFACTRRHNGPARGATTATSDVTFMWSVEALKGLKVIATQNSITRYNFMGHPV